MWIYQLVIRVFAIGALSACPISLAHAQTVRPFQIAPQGLSSAIEVFSEQSGLQVAAPGDGLAGLRTGGVRGTFEARSALDQLISGTGLRYRFTGVSSVLLVKQDPVPSAADGEVVLSPITVLGQNFGLDRSDAPASIKSFSSDEIEQRNINQVTDVLDQTPNVNVVNAATPAFFQVAIRGISDFGNVDSTGPTTGIFVDGTLLNSNVSFGSNPLLIDTESVEVLLGPQGRFQRSTTAGAINITTKKPTDEFEASFRGEIGSFPDGRATVVVNQPLLDDGLLSARLVAFGGMSDGFIEFAASDGPDTNTTDNAGFRLSLRSKPSEPLTLDASVSYSNTGYDAASNATIASLQGDDFISFSQPLDEDRLQQLISRFAVEFESDLGLMNANTSYVRTQNTLVDDGDDTPFDISVANINNTAQSFAQELTFESKPFAAPAGMGQLAINLGTSVTLSKFDSTDFTPLGDDAVVFTVLDNPSLLPLVAEVLGLPPDTPIDQLTSDNSGFNQTIDQDVLSFGINGDISWLPTDDLTLSVGARFGFDRVDNFTKIVITPTFAQASGAFPADEDTDARVTFTTVTPRASISYDWNDSLMTYFSYSTGYRPGGVSSSPVGILNFDEEKISAFEGGFRSSLLDDRLFVSGSGFFQDFDDLQVIVNDSVGGISNLIFVTNAASARSVGAEIGIGAQPLDGLSLEAQTGINFSKFIDFSGIPFAAGPDGGQTDFSGFPLPNAPRYTVSLVGEYEHPEELLPGLRGFFRTEYNYRSSFLGAVSEDPIRLSGYDTFNFRTGLRGDGFQITAFVENAFDERYATTGFASGISSATIPDSVAIPPGAELATITPGAPRRFGIVVDIDL